MKLGTLKYIENNLTKLESYIPAVDDHGIEDHDVESIEKLNNIISNFKEELINLKAQNKSLGAKFVLGLKNKFEQIYPEFNNLTSFTANERSITFIFSEGTMGLNLKYKNDEDSYWEEPVNERDAKKFEAFLRQSRNGYPSYQKFPLSHRLDQFEGELEISEVTSITTQENSNALCFSLNFKKKFLNHDFDENIDIFAKELINFSKYLTQQFNS